ncbi:MAG: hypothetical protein IKA96_02650 [Alistipes sp.]|nr:hypothetical protein [Alistipes sp.]
MANKTTSSKAKGTTAKTSISQKARVDAPATKPEIIEKPIEAVKPVVKEIDPTQYVTVLNGYQGKLTYKSKKTGELFKWNEFGSEQEMELRELRNAKNTYKKYFEKNWFMFSDEFAWVIDYLGVGQYYKNAISIDEFDTIFQKTPDELKKIIEGLSDGQKKAVAFRAKTLIADEVIDSNKVIRTLEEILVVELIERYD